MKYGNRIQFLNWRIDTDGFLRVTARVLKEGVFPYALSEIPPEWQAKFHPDKKLFNIYIPAAEFTPESLFTLEGKPVVILEHEWRDADNTLKDGFTSGNTAGAANVEDAAILIDLLITDADTIRKITDETLPTSERLVEVSAGYDGEFVVEQGTFNEQPYDGKQTNLRFNHVLLLPVGEGRCGYEVRIINKKHKEKVAMIEVRIGNRVYKFENAEDAEEAKKMAKDEGDEKSGGFDLDKVKNAMNELPGLKSKTQEHEATIEALQAELAKLKDPEEQEKAAMELLETAQQMEDVTETDVDPKDKEQIKNAMKGCCNSNARIRLLMEHLGNKNGLDVSKMDNAAVNGMFQFTAANSKRALEAAKKAGTGFVPGAVQFQNSNTGAKGTVHPLFAGMQK